MGALRVCVSASAADRLSCARDLIRACAPGTRVLIVGASRGAADDLAREVAASVPATFGLQRLSLTQLAAKTAILALACRGCDIEHVARHRSGGGARGVRCPAPAVARLFRAGLEDARVSRARSREHCRSCGWPASSGRSSPDCRSPGRDLADLLDRVEASFAAASSADRAVLFRAAARAAVAATDAAETPVADVSCFWISPTSMPPSASW